MTADSKRIVVTEGQCHACSVHSVLVHHTAFPEMRAEGGSAEQAAGRLADRLESALDTVPDPAHREAIRLAAADTRAFLGREGYAHPGRDARAPHQT